MTARVCERHPRAAAHGGQCPACLLEEALAPATDAQPQPMARFTVQMPLGATDESSVSLVAGEWPWQRLLRLKTWRRPAPADFVNRLAALQVSLERFHDDVIVRPLTAWIDADGRPCVLTDFRQGLPLLDCVAAGKLPRADARDALRLLQDRTVAAHRTGFAHGSIVPGNVFWQPGGSPFVTDFGLAAAIAIDEPAVPWPQSDLAGFAALDRSLRELDSRARNSR